MSVLNLLYWFLYVDNSLFKFREINININWVLILQLTLHYTSESFWKSLWNSLWKSWESFWKSYKVKELLWCGSGGGDGWLLVHFWFYFLSFDLFIDVEKFWVVVGGGCIWITTSVLVLFWPWILTRTMDQDQDQLDNSRVA